MSNDNPLKVVSVEPLKKKASPDIKQSKHSIRAQVNKAKYESRWLHHPEDFTPQNCMDEQYVERCWELINKTIDIKGLNIVDLGCGDGELALRLSQAGAQVTAIDIAENALKNLQSKSNNSIKLLQDALPETTLEDNAYDLVICTDVIAELHPNQFRLAISELYRLMKPNGYLLVSTKFSPKTRDGLFYFAELFSNDFKEQEWVLSYHYYYRKLFDSIHAPEKYLRAMEDSDFFEREISKQGKWAKNCSNPKLHPLWKLLSKLTVPTRKFISTSTILMKFLEKVSKKLKKNNGVSHAIMMAQRRPLSEQF